MAFESYHITEGQTPPKTLPQVHSCFAKMVKMTPNLDVKYDDT